MKYLVLVPDGAADVPCEALKGRTPLEAAHTPALDRLAREGLAGGFASTPPGAEPGTETSLLTLLGYDPLREGAGRGALEALGLGVELREDELAFRVNYVILRAGATSVVMQDPTGGGLSSEEAERLRLALLEQLPREEGEEIRLLPGQGYRAVMTWRREGEPPPRPAVVRFSPPHAILGQEVGAHFPPNGPGRRLVHLVNDSQMILRAHPLNRARIDAGRFPVNSLWPWGPGGRLSLPALEAKWGLKAAIIGVGPLLAGLARALGCAFHSPPGATGDPSTDLGAKVRAVRSALAGGETDLVLCHVAAADELSHRGEVEAKVRA
ncbi:MAG: phosphoglycerate mutase, partial [Nitrospinota bacterium]